MNHALTLSMQLALHDPMLEHRVLNLTASTESVLS